MSQTNNTFQHKTIAIFARFQEIDFSAVISDLSARSHKIVGWKIMLIVMLLVLAKHGHSIAYNIEHSIEITLLDKEGKPLPNAVLSIANSPISHPQLSKQAAIMDQVDYQFLPHVLVVAKDQWVDFPNSDDVRHHVYSFSKAKQFELRMYKANAAEKVQFTEPGLVVLGCNIHDSMIGYIYVANNEYSLISDTNGKVQLPSALLENAANNTLSSQVWHPDLSITNNKRITVDIDTTKQSQSVALDIVQKSVLPAAQNLGFPSKFKRSN